MLHISHTTISYMYYFLLSELLKQPICMMTLFFSIFFTARKKGKYFEYTKRIWKRWSFLRHRVVKNEIKRKIVANTHGNACSHISGYISTAGYGFLSDPNRYNMAKTVLHNTNYGWCTTRGITCNGNNNDKNDGDNNNGCIFVGG